MTNAEGTKKTYKGERNKKAMKNNASIALKGNIQFLKIWIFTFDLFAVSNNHPKHACCKSAE